MALRLTFSPVSPAMKAVLEKHSGRLDKEMTLPELKKKVGPVMASALNQLDATLAELDKVTTIKGIDFSKPVDQFYKWDLLEAELEPIMPGLTKKMKDLQLPAGSHPFTPSIDEIRLPFEDKMAEMVRFVSFIAQAGPGANWVSTFLPIATKSLPGPS